jgi:hypothetical protein
MEVRSPHVCAHLHEEIARRLNDGVHATAPLVSGFSSLYSGGRGVMGGLSIQRYSLCNDTSQSEDEGHDILRSPVEIP